MGRSSRADAREAAREAARLALDGRDARLLVVFCSDAYDLPALLAGFAAERGDAPLIGCSTAGEIATGGPGDAGVVVLALGGDGFAIRTAAAEGASAYLRAAGAAAAGAFDGLPDRPHPALLLLTDGLGGDQQEIVRGAYGVLGASVPLVGGCAGDGLKMTRTFQLCGDRVLTDAVVGAAIASDAPIGIGVRHGWRRVGEPMLVTESANNRVYTLDEKRALDVYFDRLGAPEDARTDQAAFTRFALTHPLGMSRRSGEEHVRFIGGANFEDGSLSTIAEVPAGALVWTMEGDSDSVLAATDAACEEAVASLDGNEPIGVLAFDCIARRGVLGDDGIRTEVERVADRSGGVPVAGFYTYGEIARTSGVSGFHNQTLVVLSVS